jgi:hypothetical protein
MPGNVIQINDSSRLTWYVGDSKMEDLIQFLDQIGFEYEPVELNMPYKEVE